MSPLRSCAVRMHLCRTFLCMQHLSSCRAGEAELARHNMPQYFDSSFSHHKLHMSVDSGRRKQLCTWRYSCFTLIFTLSYSVIFYIAYFYGSLQQRLIQQHTRKHDVPLVAQCRVECFIKMVGISLQRCSIKICSKWWTRRDCDGRENQSSKISKAPTRICRDRRRSMGTQLNPEEADCERGVKAGAWEP